MQPVNPKRAKSAEGIRPKKTKDPAPGTYEAHLSFQKSQLPHAPATLITKP